MLNKKKSKNFALDFIVDLQVLKATVVILFLNFSLYMFLELNIGLYKKYKVSNLSYFITYIHTKY